MSINDMAGHIRSITNPAQHSSAASSGPASAEPSRPETPLIEDPDPIKQYWDRVQSYSTCKRTDQKAVCQMPLFICGATEDETFNLPVIASKQTDYIVKIWKRIALEINTSKLNFDEEDISIKKSRVVTG